MAQRAAKPVCYIAAQGPRIGSTLAAALSARQARLVLLGDREALADFKFPANVEVIATEFESRATVDAAFDTAHELVGPPDQLIISALPQAAMRSRSISETSDEEWVAACKACIRSTLYCLQAAAAHMNGGSIVVLGPAFSLCGSAALVPLSTAVEAQRGLVKSAARQWGARGFCINWVGAASEALAPELSAAPLPARPERVPVALGHRPDLAAEVAPVIAFLASDAARAITGASINLDGGEWMLP